jgi:4-amino-4-deoxy-L-arabinose transferase-like glycosyltransferase
VRTSVLRWLAVLIVAVGVARIGATYRTFTQTIDESSQIACGMQLLQDHVYDIEVKHGPLARLFVALGPYLAGLRRPYLGNDETDTYVEGNAILYAGGLYWRNLTLGRLGTLPFFLLACAVVWFWTAHVFGRTAALFALLIFTFIPPVLAAASLATTDMAAAATLVAALYAFTLWMENPGWWAALRTGFAAGLAVVAKLSAVLFLPGAAALLLVLYFACGADAIRKRPLWWIGRDLAGCLVALYLAMSAGYLFTRYPIQAVHSHDTFDQYFGKLPLLRAPLHALLETPIPAGQVPGGVRDLALDNRGGHTSFLLGQWRHRGVWNFFPVLFLVKTPPPVLLLFGIGAVFLGGAGFSLQRGLQPPSRPGLNPRSVFSGAALLLLPATILALALPSNINIGLRHVLGIYPFVAMVSGYAADRLWRPADRQWRDDGLWSNLRPPIRWVMTGRAIVVGLAACLLISAILTRSNYLAYFNWLAADHPERIALDSDLDWGQDLNRLSEWLRAQGVEDVAISYYGRADLSHSGLPHFQELEPYQKVQGWVAISAYNRALPSPFQIHPLAGIPPYYAIPADFEKRPHQAGPFAWLAAYEPVARVGQSIFVYHIPAESH